MSLPGGSCRQRTSTILVPWGPGMIDRCHRNRYTTAVMKVTSSANVRRPAMEQLFRNIATRPHVVVRLSKHTEVDTESRSGFCFCWMSRFHVDTLEMYGTFFGFNHKYIRRIKLHKNHYAHNKIAYILANGVQSVIFKMQYLIESDTKKN